MIAATAQSTGFIEIIQKMFGKEQPLPPMDAGLVSGMQTRLERVGAELQSNLTTAADAYRGNDLLEAEAVLSNANGLVRDVTHLEAPLFVSDRQSKKIFQQHERIRDSIPGVLGEAVRAAYDTVTGAGYAAFRDSAYDDTLMGPEQRADWAARLTEAAGLVARATE